VISELSELNGRGIGLIHFYNQLQLLLLVCSAGLDRAVDTCEEKPATVACKLVEERDVQNLPCRSPLGKGVPDLLLGLPQLPLKQIARPILDAFGGVPRNDA
jgi:hypothetical protein